jgi:hypothetical protein
MTDICATSSAIEMHVVE